MACVDLPALPLQLLVRRNPRWRDHPVAVVDSDRPQGKILWVNERARAARILPGMRYAAALSLSGTLRAAEVPAREIGRAVNSTVEGLREFTPDVEAAGKEPGVFWLNASGLTDLYRSLPEWAHLIRFALRRKEGLESTVVVGFSKFSTQAIARASRGVTVLRSRADESAAARRVPLERLSLDPATRDLLAKLDVHTVGDFAALPPEGIEKRFGEGARQLHRQARGELRIPLEPRPWRQPLRLQVHLDYAETDVSRLLAVIARLLEPLLATATGRDSTISGVELELGFECGGRHLERLRPAAPTTDRKQLLELIHLRLSATPLPDGVADVALTAEETRTTRGQLELFISRPARDANAAHRALARIRAQFGEDTVVRAQLREGHLPEALFSWEPLERLGRAAPDPAASGALVRRILTRPVRLPARPRHEPDGWMLRGLEQGPVARVLGPYIISGGWWQSPLCREYHFAETQRGEILWVYYDRYRRRWFIQGRVE